MRARPAVGLLGAALASLISGCAWAQGMLQGRIERIIDGDTLVLAVEGRRMTVRIAGIDAPELAQPFGAQASAALQALAGAAEAQARCYGLDRWQRHLCQVSVRGMDLAQLQVGRGLAWVWPQGGPPLQQQAVLLQLQRAAQRDGLGLWVDDRALPPWLWRKGLR